MAMSKEEFHELQIPLRTRILSLFDNIDGEYLTTTEIREEIDISHQTLLKKLSELKDLGDLEEKAFPGSRVLFWKRITK